MINGEFISKFIQCYPRLYVRIISHNLAFTEENIIKFGFLLSWDKYGLLGNSFIQWTPNLKNLFSKKLLNKEYGPSSQEYVAMEFGNLDSIKVKMMRSYGSQQFLEGKEININNIRTFKNVILEWNKICIHFPEITYDFIIEFKAFINFDLLLKNPSIDWSDLRLFNFYIDSYNIIKCENLWVNFIKKFSANYRISENLKLLNHSEKFVIVHWKSDSLRKDGNIKYLLSVYAKSENGNQIIASGYHKSSSIYEKGMIIEIGDKHHFPISNDYHFK